MVYSRRWRGSVPGFAGGAGSIAGFVSICFGRFPGKDQVQGPPGLAQQGGCSGYLSGIPGHAHLAGGGGQLMQQAAQVRAAVGAGEIPERIPGFGLCGAPPFLGEAGEFAAAADLYGDQAFVLQL
ncbi:hypothetical protein [Arthrobacter sp. zg-Y1143]|uniref:hypothetical protein n=1 Tax=Arthrobacter sp. zg-Y1143 TaxID=3049065 RepID=UPI0024C27DA9|nr:hypothetical protein [Arthrobacter sp. zg-Y1143]MDK1326367.1 hypothetical protein [Arthrobacter sp. zg-Y1143]